MVSCEEEGRVEREREIDRYGERALVRELVCVREKRWRGVWRRRPAAAAAAWAAAWAASMGRRGVRRSC